MIVDKVNGKYRIVRIKYKNGEVEFFAETLAYGLFSEKWIRIQNTFGYETEQSAKNDIERYKDSYKGDDIEEETIINVL